MQRRGVHLEEVVSKNVETLRKLQAKLPEFLSYMFRMLEKRRREGEKNYQTEMSVSREPRARRELSHIIQAISI